jgi:hypothetical protein
MQGVCGSIIYVANQAMFTKERTYPLMESKQSTQTKCESSVDHTLLLLLLFRDRGMNVEPVM